MNKDIIRRAFPADLIRQRIGQGGKTLSYVEVTAVIARLNEGCDSWSFEIVEHHILEDEVLVVVKLTADGIIKTAFGGSSITRDRDGRVLSVADDLKSAASDGLKKAASLLGLALELYGGVAEETRPHDERANEGRLDERGQGPVPRPPRPVMPAIGDRLTSRQFSAIQSAARRQGIKRDILMNMIDERFRTRELGQLSRRDASSLIAELSEANGHG